MNARDSQAGILYSLIPWYHKLFQIAFVLMGVSVTNARGQFVGEATLDTRNLILTNGGPNETIYARSPKTELYFSSQGKVYFDENGEIKFGTGSHRLRNLDGQGSYISIVPSLMDAAAIGKNWVLGFRVDEMKFHWIFDEAHGGEITIVVDSLNPHSNNVVSAGVFRYGEQAQQISERSVGAEQISLRENQIVLKGISSLPYTAGRTYIKEDAGPPKTGRAPNAQGPASEATSCERKLVIKEDGTIVLQDILVHLTRPSEGEPETLLRNVILLNQYQDQLPFMEIRGTGGTVTGLVSFNRGQSVCFDNQGNPVSGEGEFQVHPRQGGQTVAGWLAATRLSGRQKLVSETTFRFTPRNLLARWAAAAVDTLKTSHGGKWKIAAAAGGTLLVAFAMIIWRSRQKRAIAGTVSS